MRHSTIPSCTFPLGFHFVLASSVARANFHSSIHTCRVPHQHGVWCVGRFVLGTTTPCWIMHGTPEEGNHPPCFHPIQNTDVNLVFTASFDSRFSGGFGLTECFARRRCERRIVGSSDGAFSDAPRREGRESAPRLSPTSSCYSHVAWRRTCAMRSSCAAVRHIPPWDRCPFSKGTLDRRNPKAFPFK